VWGAIGFFLWAGRSDAERLGSTSHDTVSTSPFDAADGGTLGSPTPGPAIAWTPQPSVVPFVSALTRLAKELKAVDLGGRIALGLSVVDVVDDRLNRYEPTPRDLE
jgi:hypothetical protein